MATGNTLTTFNNLKKKYGLKQIKSFGPSLRSKKLDIININSLLDYYRQAEKYSWPDQPWYCGTGLHYNPMLDIKPYFKQVCGNHSNSPLYQDTMSFDQSIGYDIGQLCKDYKLVRSKITCLSSQIAGQTIVRNNDWHKDETPYEALRVIIPLQTDVPYKIQLDNQEPCHLEVGWAYAFDQSKFHRVICDDVSKCDRIHLILSVVTWFDWNNDEWMPNQNWGQTHPLDVFYSLTF